MDRKSKKLVQKIKEYLPNEEIIFGKNPDSGLDVNIVSKKIV